MTKKAEDIDLENVDIEELAKTDLMAALIYKQYMDYTNTTQSLIASLRRGQAEADAELAVIRSEINELLSHPWTPSNDSIALAVFHPDRKKIRKLADESEEAKNE